MPNDFFSASIEKTMAFFCLYLINMMLCIDWLLTADQCHNFQMNPTWSWCIILLISTFCLLPNANILMMTFDKVKVIQLCPNLCGPMDSPWNSPGQNTGMGSLSLLQEIFLKQESNRGLLHCRQILYQLSCQGSPNRW